MTRGRTNRSLALLGCAVGFTLTGCSDEAEPTAEPSASAQAGSGDAIRADYVMNAGELGRADVEVIAAEPDLIRIGWTFADDDPVTELRWVYDGKRILEYGNDPTESYTVYTVPEDAEAYELVRSWVLPPGSDRLARACPDAERIGVQTIAGRTALGYRCNPRKPLSTVGRSREIWVDEATGLTLQARGLTAREVTPGAPVDADTFSTKPPEGVDVDVRPHD